MKVGFIGTGKLGGPVSEAMAESGNEVLAYGILQYLLFVVVHLKVLLENSFLYHQDQLV